MLHSENCNICGLALKKKIHIMIPYEGKKETLAI